MSGIEADWVLPHILSTRQICVDFGSPPLSRDMGCDLVENAGETLAVYSSLVKVLRVSRAGCPGAPFVISTSVWPPSSIVISRLLSISGPSLFTICRWMSVLPLSSYVPASATIGAQNS